jgi:hypothetical protein
MIEWKQSQPVADRHVAKVWPAKLVVELDRDDPTQWVAWSVPAVLAREVLKSKGLAEAKSEAVALLSSRCLAIARACE